RWQVVRFVAEMAAEILALIELEVGDPAIRNQLQHPGHLFLLQRRKEFFRPSDVDDAWLIRAAPGGVHPRELLHRGGAVGEIAALYFSAHALQRFGDRDDLAPDGVQRGG